jgi:hypothetical protein
MSLLAIIHKEVDVAIPLAEIFNRPVIEALAEFINSARKTVHVSIEPVEEKEYYKLSSAQKRLFFLHNWKIGAPLWRAALHRISDREYLLLFDMHHIIGDGTTISILVEKLKLEREHTGITLYRESRG